ncbi:hypothetical protein BDV96DRAFT_568921 [Lophiotrema nucula]|uniref:F-box domain-containing protein n=1 Tax=Lophiotrema nucula TaxID=690887 RepID=A0A6A5ZID2_9PLEO|nr:hypothetical protein BDV96DRAFT_568921 [Lophiotrema nucula]
MSNSNMEKAHTEKPLFPLRNLHDELLIVVFERLVELSPYSLDACTGVCKRFYRLALPIKYRDNVRAGNNCWDVRTKRLINSGSQIPLFVRSLLLDDRHKYGSDDAEMLIDVVNACKNVRSIQVLGSYRFSQKVLDAIEQNLPNAKIEYRAEFPREEDGYYEGWGPEGPFPGDMNGFCSRQLESLKIDSFWAVEDQGLPVVQGSLQKIIRHAPNLKHLTSWSASRCEEWRGVQQVLDLRLTSEDKLPVLESLCYIPLSLHTLRTWGTASGWGSLKVLKLAVLEPLVLLNSFGLPSLRSLTITKTSQNYQYQVAEFDKLPRIDAPLRFLSITNIGEDTLPHRFLSLFSDTLEELFLCRHRMGHPDRGYSSPEIVRLNETCPKLKKLYIRPYVDEKSEIWPLYMLKDFSHFRVLQTLVLGMENHSKIQPSQSLCEKTFSTIQDASPSCKLSELAMVHEYEGIQCAETGGFEDLLQGAKALCKIAWDGTLEAGRRKERYYDYGNKSACESAACAAILSSPDHPFTRKYGLGSRSYPKDTIWCAKQLGTPDAKDATDRTSWAREELLPAGLITEDDFDDQWTPNFAREIRKKVLGDGAAIEEHKKLVKEELRYWKRRKELDDVYGKHWSLYDVLFPVRQGS